jgi:predicted RND superfamily exporter protein
MVHQQINVDLENIRSITTLPFSSGAITAREAHALLNGPLPRTTPYQAAFQRYTNYNHTAAEIQIVLPYGQSCGGSAMLADIRRITAGLNEEYKQYGFEVYGAINVLLDSVEEVFRESPGIVALVTLVVVFAMAGLAFRSCLIPVRLLGTVVVTLLFVAGSTVLMYQYILGYDGIYWFVPICTACLVIGLTIDYDVFLISRIYEFRQSGYTTETSILRAMAKQSTTITTAGIIMTMAFSSLLLSKTVTKRRKNGSPKMKSGPFGGGTSSAIKEKEHSEEDLSM